MHGLFVDRCAHASTWRRAPVGAKAALSAALAAAALASSSTGGALAVLAVAAAVALVGARIPLLDLARFVALPLGFAAAGVLPLLVDTGGARVSLSAEGPALAALALSRSAAGSAAVAVFALTTPVGAALQRLRAAGLPEAVTDVAWHTYRFLFILGEEADALQVALSARLARAGAAARVRSAGLLVGALLVRSLERARRMERGHAARAVAPSERRT
ncbi:MAG: cobalt ECF transporter T component CbiQ [Vicinamibacteria bacterium]